MPEGLAGCLQDTLFFAHENHYFCGFAKSVMDDHSGTGALN
jgi:hypothetical protein